MLYFNVTELWMMAARGLQPRGIDMVLLELGHELVTAGHAIPFVFDPVGGGLHRAPADWFEAPAIYTHEAWPDLDGAPRRRHFSGWFPRWRRRIALPRIVPEKDNKFISLGRPEMIAAFIRRHPGLRHIAMIHDVSMETGIAFSDRRRQRRLARKTRTVAERADRLLVPSKLTAETLAALSSRPAEVLPLAHDFRRVPDPPDLDIAPGFFLHIGPLKYWKNGPRLLAAYTRARATDPALPPLVIAGRVTGENRDGVRFISAPSHREIQALYANCKGLIMPSLSEGFGLPMGEALSFGKPLIHTKNLRRLVPPAKGWIREFDGENVADFARAIRSLKDAGPATLTRRRSWGDVADEFRAIIG